MIVDCHTHIWEYLGRLSGAYVAEARARAHGVRLDFHVPPERHWSAMGDMRVVFLCVFRFVRLLMSGHRAVAMENAALRLQLAAFQRKRKRPVLTFFDRLFWVGLSAIWNGWRTALSCVQPDTVVRWQRERFRKFRARLSRVNCRRRGGPAAANHAGQLVSIDFFRPPPAAREVGMRIPDYSGTLPAGPGLDFKSMTPGGLHGCSYGCPQITL